MKKKRGNWLRTIVLMIACLVFLYSAYQLYNIYSEYNKGEKEYETIIDKTVTIEEPKEEEKTNEGQEVTSLTPHVSLSIDFDKLRAMNPDIVGWIQFTEPQKISYPMVKGENNDQYLRTTVENKRNTSGSIFVDAYNAGDFSDKNTFIYGHNMRNGSMFGQLKKYREQEFYNQYPYFYIYTPDGNEVTYQIFAVCVVESDSESYLKSYLDDQEYIDYLKHIKSIALYDTGVVVDEKSQLVSLSTCTNVKETERLLVHGVKISESKMGE